MIVAINIISLLFLRMQMLCVFLRLGVLRRIYSSLLNGYHSLHLMNSDIFQKRFPIVWLVSLSVGDKFVPFFLVL